MKDITIPIKLPSRIKINKKEVTDVMQSVIERCINNKISPADLYVCIFGLIQFFAASLEDQEKPIDILKDMIAEFEHIESTPIQVKETETKHFKCSCPIDLPIIVGEEVNVDLSKG